MGRARPAAPGTILAIGLAIVVLVLIPAFQINPSDAELKNEPATGDAQAGREALTAAGIPDGVYLPYVVLAEGGPTPSGAAGGRGGLAHGTGASTARRRHRSGAGRHRARRGVRHRRRELEAGQERSPTCSTTRCRRQQRRSGRRHELTLGGAGPESRDFVHAVYGKFPYVLLFVLVLTYILLARAFRSLVLPLKAVILNLVSLGAAYGIVVFIFQKGHGSEPIWNIQATDAIISWIPLMIFAFLFGISMDYEVFMITRMREAYDETGDTKRAISLGLARTGKLVTSAAARADVRVLLALDRARAGHQAVRDRPRRGIIFDATVIRALLVPSTMHLLGRWNWWLPGWAATLLRTAPSPLAPRGRRSPRPKRSRTRGDNAAGPGKQSGSGGPLPLCTRDRASPDWSTRRPRYAAI